jgi:NAD(P)-dependent dehydrogenase (short-subunit alcohol dehydrogenase family)
MASRKSILLVGGNSGIGLATMENLKTAGHHVFIAARHAPEGEPYQPFDAMEPAPLVLPDSLDGLVYCPGTVTLKPFHRLTPADFQRDLQVNLFGAIAVLQQALPALKKSGDASVVLFSSIAAGTGLAMHTSIAAAKAAVEGLALSLAAELAPAVRVNVIAPSLTRTPLVNAFLGSPEKEAAAAARHPLKCVGEPAEVAALVAFLLGDGARAMTGQILRPDGGMSSVRLF